MRQAVMSAATPAAAAVRLCWSCQEPLPVGSHGRRRYHVECRQVPEPPHRDPTPRIATVAIKRVCACGSAFLARSEAQRFCDLNCYVLHRSSRP